MRLRKKKNASARFDACADWILTGEQTAKWCSAEHLAIEIGSGKGGFITELARQNPDTRYIAVEKEVDCIVMALEKAKAAGIDNLRFLAEDAKELGRLLPHRKFQTIYLNFSDPWPKKKYGKRRLTHRNMLSHFIDLLTEDGQLRFKTDNDKLFGFTVEEWNDIGMDISFVTYDLHKEAVPNVMTEYEKRFSDLGTPIKSMWARPTGKTYQLLHEYRTAKDVFPFHCLIVSVSDTTVCDTEPVLWRMLDSIGIRACRLLPCREIQTPLFRFPTADTPDFSKICSILDGKPTETALLSDNADLITAAQAAGLYTIAVGAKIDADDHWQSLDKENLVRNLPHQKSSD